MKRLHKRNYLHKNLCIENIYLDENLEPCIAGHGFENYIESSFSYRHIGSYDKYFESPRSLENRYEKEFDVYAFAFFLYRMFSLHINYKRGHVSHYKLMHNPDLRPQRPD